MPDSFVGLATINLTDNSGKAWSVKAADIRRSQELQDGARVFFYDGFTLDVNSKPTAITTAIDTLWDEYLAALGDPA